MTGQVHIPVLKCKRRAFRPPLVLLKAYASGASEFIIEADDIVFAEIGAGLHFDQLQ